MTGRVYSLFEPVEPAKNLFQYCWVDLYRARHLAKTDLLPNGPSWLFTIGQPLERAISEGSENGSFTIC